MDFPHQHYNLRGFEVRYPKSQNQDVLRLELYINVSQMAEGPTNIASDQSDISRDDNPSPSVLPFDQSNPEDEKRDTHSYNGSEAKGIPTDFVGQVIRLRKASNDDLSRAQKVSTHFMVGTKTVPNKLQESSDTNPIAAASTLEKLSPESES